jgi:hypothetical protein
MQTHHEMKRAETETIKISQGVSFSTQKKGAGTLENMRSQNNYQLERIDENKSGIHLSS